MGEGANMAVATTSVTIKGAGGTMPGGNVRRLGDPVPDKQQPGPNWTYKLAPGKYIFNVDIVGIAPNVVSFTFTGAVATPPTSFTIPGSPGDAGAANRDIEFKV
jgi:hypothetical protein